MSEFRTPIIRLGSFLHLIRDTIPGIRIVGKDQKTIVVKRTKEEIWNLYTESPGMFNAIVKESWIEDWIMYIQIESVDEDHATMIDDWQEKGCNDMLKLGNRDRRLTLSEVVPMLTHDTHVRILDKDEQPIFEGTGMEVSNNIFLVIAHGFARVIHTRAEDGYFVIVLDEGGDA